MRLFLAINLDAAMRRSVLEATAPLRAAAPSIKWVDDARLHLTLKFIGEQPEAAVPALAAAMDGVVGGHRRFHVDVGEVGAFPNFRRARVVWMGVAREPRLELLHHDVEVACATLGYELDGRAFRPHLTLGRARERTELEELRRLSRAARTVRFEETTAVRSIDLMRSVPPDSGGASQGTSGPRYDLLHAAPLEQN